MCCVKRSSFASQRNPTSGLFPLSLNAYSSGLLCVWGRPESWQGPLSCLVGALPHWPQWDQYCLSFPAEGQQTMWDAELIKKKMLSKNWVQYQFFKKHNQISYLFFCFHNRIGPILKWTILLNYLPDHTTEVLRCFFFLSRICNTLILETVKRKTLRQGRSMSRENGEAFKMGTFTRLVTPSPPHTHKHSLVWSIYRNWPPRKVWKFEQSQPLASKLIFKPKLEQFSNAPGIWGY